MSEAPDFVRVGTITRSHGLRGQVVLKAVSGLEEFLPGIPQLRILGEAARVLTVERVHTVGRSLVLGFEELSRREHSDALIGQDLWAEASQIVLPEGVVATEDLIGVAVRLEDGTALGTLSDVWQTGANDVYVVRSETDEWLLPATGQVLVKLDLQARTAVVRLLPGLEPTPVAKKPAAKKAGGDEP